MRAPSAVDVWVTQFQPAAIPDLESILTSAELARADRCRIPLVRQRQIFARARLRQILGHYLDLAPPAIEIELGTQGKPQVRGLEFNLSHSADLVVCAVSQQPVGIDIEWRRAIAMHDLVRRFFAPPELAVWQQLPADRQELAFFRAWTQKEAYLKAIGTGLHTPLSAVVVEMNPDRPCNLLATSDRRDWQLSALDLPAGYLGVVVMSGQNNRVNMQQWPMLPAF